MCRVLWGGVGGRVKEVLFEMDGQCSIHLDVSPVFGHLRYW